jgi:hypothetical protein
MKKIYVKPEAFSVAFAVNENIATSGDISTTDSSDGFVKYIQNGDNCNKLLSNTGNKDFDSFYDMVKTYMYGGKLANCRIGD